MDKRVLGYLLAISGFIGMVLAGYIFVTGSGGRIHLIEVTAYMISGAACFFAGINYIYESANAFTEELHDTTSEFEEVSPIQQEWRTIQICTNPATQPDSSSVQAETA
jgi:hypothetical protein